jgi:hypothetical protein
MRVLYVVFVLSIIALIWTAVAVARHIRRHESEHKASGERQHPETIEEPETVSRSDSE